MHAGPRIHLRAAIPPLSCLSLGCVPSLAACVCVCVSHFSHVRVFSLLFGALGITFYSLSLSLSSRPLSFLLAVLSSITVPRVRVRVCCAFGASTPHSRYFALIYTFFSLRATFFLPVLREGEGGTRRTTKQLHPIASD